MLACIFLSFVVHLTFEKWWASLAHIVQKKNDEETTTRAAFSKCYDWALFRYLSLTHSRTLALVNTLYMLCFSIILLTANRPTAKVNNGECLHTYVYLFIIYWLYHVDMIAVDPAETLLRWEPGTSYNFSEGIRQIEGLWRKQEKESERFMRDLHYSESRCTNKYYGILLSPD